MDSEKTPRKSRRRCIVLGAVVVLVVLILALALGLYYGLKSDDDGRSLQPQKHVSLKVLSVRSDGLVGDTVRVTVVYQALPDHYIDWRFMSDDPIRSTGKRTTMIQDGLKVFECSNDVPIKIVRRTHIIITSGVDGISMAITNTTALSAWTYVLPQMENPFAYFNASVEAPESGNLTIYASLNINMSGEYSSPANALFIYLNTSADPPSVYEQHTFDNHITVSKVPSSSSSSSSSSNTTDVVFTLTQDIAQFGGQFNIQIPNKIDQRYLEQFKHSVWIDVFRAGSNEMIPKGISGLTQKRSRIKPIFGDVYTVTCNAMGNPSPEVEILRQVDGKSYKMKSETLYRDRWTRMEIYTLRDKNTESGNYTCRAVSGTSTSTTVIEVYAAEKTRFVSSETGVVERTADRIVVRCTATGVPTPILTFRRIDPDEFQVHHLADWYFGDDIIKSGIYKYYRNVTETSASLTMTISPVNATIQMLSCDAAAPPGYYWSTSTSIDLRPGSTSTIPV